jgi:hypothetical protein
MKTMKWSTLSAHPLPAALAHSTYGMRITEALTALEESLISSEQDKTLLLLENDIMEDVFLIVLERFLRYAQCHHLLVLVSKKNLPKMMRTWEHAVSWDDDRHLTAQFQMTSMPQDAQEVQVCITSVFDIQMHITIALTHPFFKGFDAILVYDVPAILGPALHQIVDLFAVNETRVVGFSSTLSQEEGELLFGKMIEQKRATSSKLKHA